MSDIKQACECISIYIFCHSMSSDGGCISRWTTSPASSFGYRLAHISLPWKFVHSSQLPTIGQCLQWFRLCRPWRGSWFYAQVDGCLWVSDFFPWIRKYSLISSYLCSGQLRAAHPNLLLFWDSIPSPVEVPMVNEIRPTWFKAAETAINNNQGAVPAVIDPPASKTSSEQRQHPSPGDWIGLKRILPFEDYGLQNSVSPSAPSHPLSELAIAILTKWVWKYAPVATTHQDLYLPCTLPATKHATNVPDFTIPLCMFDHLVECDLFLKALDDHIGGWDT